MSVPKYSHKTRNRIAILFALLSFFLLLTSSRMVAGIPEQIGLSIMSVLQQVFDTVGNFFSSTVTSITELRELQKKYQDLLKRTELLKVYERDYVQLKRENELLKEQLGLLETIQYEAIPARIIAKDPNNQFYAIILNKGIKDGIKRNMAVIAYQNGIEGLVGRIIEVSSHASIVLPIFESSSYIAARLSTSRYEGLVNGRGSDTSNLVMQCVRKSAKNEIQLGDIIVTSGFQSLYPPEIAIGRVKKIEEPKYVSSLEISVEPILDFSRIEYVFILKDVPKEK